MIQQTSILSYTQCNEEGIVTGQQRAILARLRAEPDQCINEISIAIGIQKSSVSPRLKELRERGLVVGTGKKVFQNRTVCCWRAI